MQNIELTGRHLIAGEWAASSGPEFRAVNPATGDRIGATYHEAGEREVARAADAARKAFQLSRAFPTHLSARLLDGIADEILAAGDPLLEVAEQETALPRPRLIGERQRTCSQLKLFATLVREGGWLDATIDRADPNRKPAPRPDVRRVNRPIGPVAIFEASNFPFAFGVCGGDTASALAAGNPVIVKAHPSHPGTAELFAGIVLRALQKLDLPPGLFSVLQGQGKQLGAMLVQNDAIEAVGFTGSLGAGRALFDLGARRPRPIPVYAEMGSLNPLVMLPGAIASGATLAQRLTESVVMGCGQFCTKPGVVLLLDSDQSRGFVGALRDRLASIGNQVLLNAGIRDKFVQQIQQLTKVAGVQTLLPPAPSGHAATTASLLQVDAATWLAREELRHETFGPGVVIVFCRDAREIRDALDAAGGNLTSTIHADRGDDATVRELLPELENIAGRVIFGDFPTGVEVGCAMVHGGPYPATTAPATTSVGAAAIRRYVRPLSYQSLPDHLLPPALQDANPLGVLRTVDSAITRDAIARPVA